jgi:hypothetical protein
MTDRIPHTESDLVLVDVKAKPYGWPPASLDPDPRARSIGNQRARRPIETTNLKSLRFQGIPARPLLARCR